ncbi:uncharacterized protein K02A2.6-like [Frankliniella occidentalis]|uniref:RNA-directed DNA polymerase n=1 Tax=Frankliniella occidentalis TaxID=133901 RepID=A0A9C6X9M1_FRAOC|nr:uncharacterized protein K02A2.6-like [Frankliniella occidentalis]
MEGESAELLAANQEIARLNELVENLKILKRTADEELEETRLNHERWEQELIRQQNMPPGGSADTQVMFKLLQNIEILASNMAANKQPVYHFSDKQFPKFNIDKPTEWDRFESALTIAFSDVDGHALDDKQKRRILLQNAGDGRLFNLASDLLKSKKKDISTASFGEIITALRQFFKPKISPAAAYAKFTGLKQLSNEPALQFVARLQAAAADCSFEDKTSDLLLWQFVVGISNQSVQHHLLNTEEKLTFESAIGTVTTSETTSTHVRALQGTEYASGAAGGTSATTLAAVHHAGAAQQGYQQRGHGAHQGAAASSPSYNGKPQQQQSQHQNQQQQQQQKQKGCSVGAPSPVSVRATQEDPGAFPPHTAQLFRVGEAHLHTPPSPVSFPLEKFAGQCDPSSLRPSDPVIVHMELDGQPATMEVDNGATYTTMASGTYDLLWPHRPPYAPGQRPDLQPVEILLQPYLSSPVTAALGARAVRVRFRNIEATLPLVVVEGPSSLRTLMGRNWFPALGISVAGLNHLSPSVPADIQLHPALNQDPNTLGCYKGPPVQLDWDKTAAPKYLPARSVPYAIEDNVVDVINTLHRQGAISPTPYAPIGYATPVVIVHRPDGRIRMCGDYKSTVNKVLRPDRYPLPTADAAFAKIANATVFSKIDLDQAFTQVPVDDAAADLLTINTIRGLYRVHRLPFGISAASGIFQRLMTDLLAGLQGVVVLQDDILICGQDIPTHDERLRIVLDKVHNAGLRIRPNKCLFRTDAVVFLGFRVDIKGIHPVKDKVDAIRHFPSPRDKQQLQSFLGLVNFYDRYFPDKATRFEPLYRLLNKDTPWSWTEEHETAVKYVKDILLSDQVLDYYDPKKPICMSVDASDYGVSAVLAHIYPDGLERPVASASRTLTPAERRYDTFNKEATALLFGITKFHKYIYGKSGLIIYTDHKPLVGFFKPHAPTPEHISPRLLRWSVIMGSYDYQIVHRAGKKNGNADAFSRLPLPHQDDDVIPEAAGIHLLELSSGCPVNNKEVLDATVGDPVLLAVHEAVYTGHWPTPLPAVLQPYHNVKTELTTLDTLVLRGDRVVIPEALRERVLNSLHAAHHGMTRMKDVAYSFVWWPGLHTQIVELVKTCPICQEHQRNPHCTYKSWPTPTGHWERVHIDYCVYHGQNYLVLVDAWSRWPEVIPVSTLTAAELIRHVRNIFAAHGVPRLLVSDNGSQLVSQDFNNFLAHNGCKHLTSAPYFPQSNGLAERTVGSFKSILKKLDGEDCHAKTARALFAMRITPCSATGEPPAERVFHRRLRTPWDVIKPTDREAADDHDGPPTAVLAPGQHVSFRDHRPDHGKYSHGVIVESIGTQMYRLRDDDNVEHCNVCIANLLLQYIFVCVH